MTGSEEADELKARGNQFFKEKEYLKAAAQYTAAIKKFTGSENELAVLHRYASGWANSFYVIGTLPSDLQCCNVPGPSFAQAPQFCATLADRRLLVHFAGAHA